MDLKLWLMKEEVGDGRLSSGWMEEGKGKGERVGGKGICSGRKTVGEGGVIWVKK